jgi:hypothetical protein
MIGCIIGRGEIHLSDFAASEASFLKELALLGLKAGHPVFDRNVCFPGG